VVKGRSGTRARYLSHMVTDDLAEAVYHRLLHNIASEGWQTNHEVVSLSPPLSLARAHFNSAFPSGAISLHRDLQCGRTAIQN
jgi:hypothetical protein